MWENAYSSFKSVERSIYLYIITESVLTCPHNQYFGAKKKKKRKRKIGISLQTSVLLNERGFQGGIFSRRCFPGVISLGILLFKYLQRLLAGIFRAQ